ncbi:hypothetical protein ABEV34_04595 [Methylorubrum rhodesianum]|uniref:hypothetical protein n=1 Tax=Methylorubrum rhodesianum TaxID=29427 RepID=UPI003D2813C0
MSTTTHQGAVGAETRTAGQVACAAGLCTPAGQDDYAGLSQIGRDMWDRVAAAVISHVARAPRAASGMSAGEDLLRRSDVIAACAEMADGTADMALYGDPEHAQRREAMEATATRLKATFMHMAAATPAHSAGQGEETPGNVVVRIEIDVRDDRTESLRFIFKEGLDFADGRAAVTRAIKSLAAEIENGSEFQGALSTLAVRLKPAQAEEDTILRRLRIAFDSDSIADKNLALRMAYDALAEQPSAEQEGAR